jgi:hypothetical protein
MPPHLMPAPVGRTFSLVSSGHGDILMSSHGGSAIDSREVLKRSEVKEGKDRYPSRIVLRRAGEKTYATHVEVMPAGGAAYFILGRYFFGLDDAEQGFLIRTKEIEGF